MKNAAIVDAMTYSNTSSRISGKQAYIYRPVRKKKQTGAQPKPAAPKSPNNSKNSNKKTK
ncbi:hypothetical protein GCM10007100_30460 [Roseibacillus persicicus]|uniref:Uncharacterized protein n=1 Tax=Roseibacillus persicicus TaxID=454148 RepID=A0A918TUW2_9BACT|nr:hypothetical protein GCM10007100_30460 [Roseibacillus persicicus]